MFDIEILVSVVIWYFTVGDLHFWGFSIFRFVKSCFAQPFGNREQTKQASSSGRQQNVRNLFSFSVITSSCLFLIGINKNVFVGRYKLMLNCWAWDSGIRPTFAEVRHRLDEIFGENLFLAV